MLTKTLTAGLMALSLTVTPIASAPAHADATDVVEALVGIAALMVIIDKLDGDDGGKNKKRRSVTPRDTDRDYRRDTDRDDRRDRRRVLPSSCVRRVEMKGKTRNVVLERCLDRHGYHRQLPKSCEMPRVSRHFGSEAYRVGCLTDRGYRVAGR